MTVDKVVCAYCGSEVPVTPENVRCRSCAEAELKGLRERLEIASKALDAARSQVWDLRLRRMPAVEK